MIKFSATNALVHAVTPVIEIESRSGGQPFHKRELIIDDSWDKDGKHYSNFVSIEFTGDKMTQLDSIYPGQRVNIEGMLCGREYNSRIFNTVRGLSVAPYQAQQQYAPAPAPMPGGYAPSQPQYQQAAGYGAAPMPGGYSQQAAPTPAYPQQPQQQVRDPFATTAPASPQLYGGHPSPGVNDLPFTTG